LSQPLIANIHGLKEVKEGGEADMEEKNQQDRLLGSGSIPVYPPFWGMDFVIVLSTYLFDFSSPPP
jgi:hypothetical protein